MWCKVMTLLVVVVACVVPSSRAAVHCQPGDEGCAQCQATCDAIPLPALPECCEAHSACCPTYSQACGHCKANAAIDPHFPEYCCASFTDCCDMVPGLNIVADFNAKQQGSKIPSKDGPPKSIQRQPRSDSPDEPHAEPEPEPETVADTESASDAAHVTEAPPPGPRPKAKPAASTLSAPTEEDTRIFKPVVVPRPAQDESEDLEVEARSAVAAVSRGRGRTRADANLSSGSVLETTSAPAPVPVRASSLAVNRATSAGRLTSPRSDRTTATLISPAEEGDDPGLSQSSSSVTRSRQATVLSRRSQPSEADRKVIAAASLDRRGRITSRGRVV